MKKRRKVTVINPPQPPTPRQQTVESLKQLGWIVIMVVVILVVGTFINKTATKLTRDYWEWANEP
jgi:hypothetical protein